MSLQDKLIEQVIKTVDFGKIAQEVLSKIDIKNEIANLQGDLDGDGIKDLAEVQDHIGKIKASVEEIVKLLILAHKGQKK